MKVFWQGVVRDHLAATGVMEHLPEETEREVNGLGGAFLFSFM
jgi:hypothetical protein